MTQHDSQLKILPCLDSDEMAAARRHALDVSRIVAAGLGKSAVEIAQQGHYLNPRGTKVDLRSAVEAACNGKRSIRPDDALPTEDGPRFPETRVQVTNETTFGAAQRFLNSGLRPVALNFANGVSPGGGFLGGARAQEEVLCRSSALFQTLIDDPMYESHRDRERPDSTDWAIYSPDVPVFRTDDGTDLEEPWLLSFITCAAPYAPEIGQPESGDLLHKRIHRVLAIARAFGHSSLVLGAWGCGAFENDPHRTPQDFRDALENEFRGVFSDIVFAITDWSSERKFLGPFGQVFTTTQCI